MAAEWEVCQSSAGKKTERLAVPGGWIYVVTEKSGDGRGILSQTAVFVPGPPPDKEPT